MIRLVLIPVLISMGAAVILITGTLSTARQQNYPDSWLLYDVRHSDSFEMHRMNPDTRRTTTLTTGNFYFYPIGSPNGAWFAFWGWQNKRWNLYQMRIDGSAPRVVLANQRNLLGHYWSEDGSQLETYYPHSGFSRDSYVRIDGNPVLSPDGEWLAFVSRRSPAGLYRMRTDHTDFQLIAADYNITEYSISWSPDSEWIAYVSRHNRKSAIFRARVDGTRVERLTSQDIPYRRISWMPAADLPLHALMLLLSGLGIISSGLMLFRRRRAVL